MRRHAAPPVLFRVAAGPRLGFGHLVRSRSLARALGTPLTLSLRGTPLARRTAEAIGDGIVEEGGPAAVLATHRPRLLIVDDPSATASAPWCRAARRHDIPVASVHDLGSALCESTIAIDGSIMGNAAVRRRRGALVGPRYAVLDPHLQRAAGRRRTRARHPVVLVALGGGRHDALATRIAEAIVRRHPAVHVRIAGGAGARSRRRDRIEHLAWLPTLAGELASCTVAVVAGGVTLYEACALAVPCVAVPVVPPQARTVRAFTRRGLALHGGAGFPARAIERPARRSAELVVRLLRDRAARRVLSRAARRAIDGQGAHRVARVLTDLVERDPTEAAA